MTQLTATARLRGIYMLVACLEGSRPDLTPAEVLRNINLVGGWTFKAAIGSRPGTYCVDAGDGQGERLVRREVLLPLLTVKWLPAAKAELPKETTAP